MMNTPKRYLPIRERGVPFNLPLTRKSERCLKRMVTKIHNLRSVSKSNRLYSEVYHRIREKLNGSTSTLRERVALALRNKIETPNSLTNIKKKHLLHKVGYSQDYEYLFVGEGFTK